jgi:hypothetical protein
MAISFLVGGPALLFSAIFGSIHFKRRRRLRMQQAGRTTIDLEGPLPDPETETEFKELPLPLTSSPPVPKSPIQPHTQDQTDSEQSPSSTSLRADAEERNKLVETMHYIQQRLLLLEGERVQDGGVQKKMLDYSGRPEPAT